jgi:hypothetical protein
MTLENPIGDEQSSIHSENKSEDHTEKTDNVVPPLSTETKTKPCCIKKDITCNIKRDWIDKLTISLEALGFLALVVYAIFTIKIWHANNKSAKAAQSAAATAASTLTEIQKGATDTHDLATAAKQQAENTSTIAKSALTQATAARLSAEAQEAQLDVSRRTFKLQNGADLSVSYMGIDERQTNRIKFTILNAGPSHAFTVRVYRKLEYRTNEPPDTQDAKSKAIFPKDGETLDKKGDGFFEVVDIPPIKSGKLYLWGTVWYEDASGRQWKQFCLYLPGTNCQVSGFPSDTFCRCSNHRAAGYE